MSGLRIRYKPDEWEPGDPLYARPRSNIEGNHVRQFIQLVEIAGHRGQEHVDLDGRLVWVDSELRNSQDATSCSCADRTRWPEPLPQSGLSEQHDLKAILARHDRQDREQERQAS